MDTKGQSGLLASWAGSVVVWRSSRQTVSALSTAEAELNAAALGWQIMEGFRVLLQSLGMEGVRPSLLVDNSAALSIAQCGANWRTRYFAVRAKRLQEESERGELQLAHCPQAEMLADGLTKLATPTVLEVLRLAMNGHFPNSGRPTPSSSSTSPASSGSATAAAAIDGVGKVMGELVIRDTSGYRVRTSPGKHNRSDITGDGPAAVPSHRVSLSPEPDSDPGESPGVVGPFPFPARGSSSAGGSGEWPPVPVRRGVLGNQEKVDSSPSHPTGGIAAGRVTGELESHQAGLIGRVLQRGSRTWGSADRAARMHLAASPDGPLLARIIAQLYEEYSPDKADRLPQLQQKYEGQEAKWLQVFVQHHGISLRDVVTVAAQAGAGGKEKAGDGSRAVSSPGDAILASSARQQQPQQQQWSTPQQRVQCGCAAVGMGGPVPEIISAGVAVTRQQGDQAQLLVVCRNAGLWQLPKGRRTSSDQSLSATASRELWEEAGMRLPEDGLLHPWERVEYPTQHGYKHVQFYAAHIDTRDIQAQLKLAEKSTEAIRWVGVDELAVMRFQGPRDAALALLSDLTEAMNESADMGKLDGKLEDKPLDEAAARAPRRRPGKKERDRLRAVGRWPPAEAVAAMGSSGSATTSTTTTTAATALKNQAKPKRQPKANTDRAACKSVAQDFVEKGSEDEEYICVEAENESDEEMGAEPPRKRQRPASSTSARAGQPLGTPAAVLTLQRRVEQLEEELAATRAERDALRTLLAASWK